MKRSAGEERTDLDAQLADLWVTTITKLTLDPLTRTVDMHLTAIDVGEEKTYQVLFEGVVAFFLARKQIEEDYLELSSITHERSDKVKVKLPLHPIRKFAPNFVLEIWTYFLYVQADSITINGQVYAGLLQEQCC
ncbi:MAG: hypothetical protein JWO42_4042 [Chloroflexi bacterium]|nr:hypothetical protein [Chloroflexota bacterium]